MSFDPLVRITKTDTMRLMLLHVSRGYFYWTSGEVEASRALPFAAKMADQYGADIDRNRRARAREAGQANAVLFMYPARNSTKLKWWLLATEGEGEVRRREKMLDTRFTGQRLTWSPGYEVAPMTKQGRQRPAWSWRIKPEEMRDWCARLRQAARSTDPTAMQQAIWSMFRVPGFASARSQVGHLLAYAKREWKIAGNVSDFPPCPPKLFYIRHRVAEAQPLSALVRRAARGGVGWFGNTARNIQLDNQQPRLTR
ncbi:MAG: hypothetical protein V4650_01380 [Pseudomonadota bacterium]